MKNLLIGSLICAMTAFVMAQEAPKPCDKPCAEKAPCVKQCEGKKPMSCCKKGKKPGCPCPKAAADCKQKDTCAKMKDAQTACDCKVKKCKKMRGKKGCPKGMMFNKMAEFQKLPPAEKAAKLRKHAEMLNKMADAIEAGQTPVCPEMPNLPAEETQE